MTKLRGWIKGDPYCGTALEAINFALDNTFTICVEEFLTAWRGGDLHEWPEFQFRVCEHKWTGWIETGRTGDWFKPIWAERTCTICGTKQEEDM